MSNLRVQSCFNAASASAFAALLLHTASAHAAGEPLLALPQPKYSVNVTNPSSENLRISSVLPGSEEGLEARIANFYTQLANEQEDLDRELEAALLQHLSDLYEC